MWEFDTPDLDGYKSLKRWKVQRQYEELFTDKRDRAEWGTLYFTGPSVRSASPGSLFQKVA
jgi:hypothetical protein